MQGYTLKIIAKYLEDEKRDAKVINMFKNSGGECLGFVYAWIINDIIGEHKDFTKFTREIDKLKNKEQPTLDSGFISGTFFTQGNPIGLFRHSNFFIQNNPIELSPDNIQKYTKKAIR